MFDLAGQVALVTGATSGIGRATACALAARGAHVLIVGRNDERGQRVLDDIEAAGGQAQYLRASLRDAPSARGLADRARAAAGGVDILVNNAALGRFGPTSAITEDAFDATFSTNVKVPFFLVAELGPAMAERGHGAIVNVSTIYGSLGETGRCLYGASKAAMELLTRAWAAEFGPQGVRVNAVAAGPTRTEGVERLGRQLDEMAAKAPAGRVATPEEIADAIVFLAGGQASFVQGAVLAVDGGRLAV